MTTATINRIKQYVERPQSKPNRDTAAMYGTVVMAALETMHGLMTGFDNELAFKVPSWKSKRLGCGTTGTATRGDGRTD